jgi:hypothetical protein
VVDSLGAAVVPPLYEWRFRNLRAGEERTYQQTELSIEGEARLIGIAARVGEALRQAGYSWGQIGDMFDESSDSGVDQLLSLIANVAPATPELMTDAACVLLGLFPTDDFGRPDPEYDGHRVFIRRTINLTRFGDMLWVLLAQNDYQRLVRPFSKTLATAMGTRLGTVSEVSAPSPDAYSLEPVALADDSPPPSSQ